MAEQEVMKPEISGFSLSGSTYSHMSDVHDNTSMPIDFHKIADSISDATATIKQATTEPVAESDGTLKQFWKGIVEDVMGKPNNKTV